MKMCELNNKINEDIRSLYDENIFFKELWRQFVLRHFASHIINNKSCKELEIVRNKLRDLDSEIDFSSISRASSECYSEKPSSSLFEIMDHLLEPEQQQKALLGYHEDEIKSLNNEVQIMNDKIEKYKQKNKRLNSKLDDIKAKLLRSFKRLSIEQSKDSEVENILTDYIRMAQSLHDVSDSNMYENKGFQNSYLNKVSELESSLAD